MLCIAGPPDASAITIRAVEEPGHIALDRLLERHERNIVAGAAQVLHVAPRKVLVFAANRLRHIDIFDVGRAAECAEHGLHQVAEAARHTSTDIENPRYPRPIDEPAYDRDRVVHIDEIAHLLAIGDAGTMRLEQPDGPPAFGIVE